MRYRPSLPPERVAEVAAQHHSLWGTGRTVDEHAAHNLAQLDRAGPMILRYVGLEDDHGTIVASLKRYGLIMKGPFGEARALGIGAVFTRPSHRGKGVIAELLQRVMDEARDHGDGAALLYSDIEPGIYARRGFVALPSYDYVAQTADLPAQGALSLRPIEWDQDLDRLLGWYEEAWQEERPGFVRPGRSRAILRYFKWRNGIGGYVLSDGGRDVGYVFATLDDPLRDLPEDREPGLLWVDEQAAPGVAHERLWATIRAIAEARRAPLVRGWVVPGVKAPPHRLIARTASIAMIAPLAPHVTVDPVRAFLDSFQHF